MAVEVERLLVTLEARLDNYDRNLNQAQAITNQRLNTMERRFAQWSANLKASASTAAMGIGSVLGGIGAYLGVGQVIEFSNEWTRLTRAVDASARVFGVSLKSAGELTKLANDARVDVDAYGKLYIRTTAAIRDYGYSSDDAAKVTSTLAKALKLGGAAASEQASVLLQFSQALQKGKLDGDEFRSVMENAGVVQELLAARLKVSKGELLKMAADGKLAVKDLVGAMIDGGARVDRIFSQMPTTIDEAFAVVRNNVVQFIGEFDKATGASQTFSAGLVTISQNLGAVAVAAGALMGSAALRMAAFAAASVAAVNPVSLLAAAIGALSVGYAVFGDEVSTSSSGFSTLKDSVSAFYEVVGGDAQSALGQLTSALRDIGGAVLDLASDAAKSAWASASDMISGLAQKAIEVDRQYGGLGASIVNAFAEGSKAIADTIGLTDALSYSINAANRVAERANQIALARGVEARDYGLGLREALEGKRNFVAGKTPAGASSTAKRSEYEREVDQIKKRTAALQAEASTIGQTVYLQERAKAAAELRTAAATSAAKEGRKVTADELAAIEKLSDAYGKAQAEAHFLAKLQGERDNIRELQDEVALVGLEGEALYRARIEQQLLNEARRQGVEVSSAQRSEIDALASREASLKRQIEIINDMRDTSRDALKSFVSDMREGKSATEALGNSLNRLADKLIDMGVNSLVENALGGLVGGGGLFSGAAQATTTGWATSVLPTFAKGGVSRGPAIFGEAGPEAAVPLPDGRSIPVSLKVPPMPAAVAAQSAPNLQLSINIDARGASGDAVAKMQSDLVPTIQKVVRAEVNQMFDRSARFAKSGI